MIIKSLDDVECNKWIERAVDFAKTAFCLRSQCGCVIIDEFNNLIGWGNNSPPKNIPPDICRKNFLPINFKSDKTCCVHAEQRAIMQMFKNGYSIPTNATLYFIRLDEKGNKKFSGDPYCTICSKLVLDAGIKNFVLYRSDGFYIYDTVEYNDLSFKF